MYLELWIILKRFKKYIKIINIQKKQRLTPKTQRFELSTPVIENLEIVAQQ